MFKIITLFFILFLAISNHSILLSGAKTGLLLWYENVLPLLLPFMLISGMIEESVTRLYSQSKSPKNSSPIIYILGLGIFCGYPIGAKTTSFFIEKNLISKKMGNIILPLCNNVSPMFFIGFILNNILCGTVSIIKGYIIIYLPLILVLLVEFIITSKSTLATADSKINFINQSNESSTAEKSIQQITFVGLYIMICSILAEFVLCFEYIPINIRTIVAGIIEITRGVVLISDSSLYCNQIKTALILSFTSFGGISSVMQTSKVIQNSGLSLIHYISIKLLCAITTYILCLLII